MVSLTSKQQARLAAVPAEQRAALRAHFQSQLAGKSGGIAPPPGIPQSAKPKPKAKAKSRSSAPPARQAPSLKAKGKGKAPRAQVSKVFMPLPDVEAAYYVLPLNTVFEVATHGYTAQCISVGGYMGMGLGSYSGGSPAYPNPMVDLIATIKDGSLQWGQTIGDDHAIRCSVIDRPPQAAAVRVNTERRARLAGIELTVQCLGAENGYMAPGEIFVGKAALFDSGTRPSATAPLSDTLYRALVEARKLHSFPAIELTTKAVHIAAAPADPVAYRRWNDFSINAETEGWGNNEMHEGLENLFVWVPPVGNVSVRYRIVVNSVWCIRSPSEVLLTAGSIVHKPTPHAQWQARNEQLARSGPRLVPRSL